MAERIKEFVRGEFPHSFAAVERLAAQVNFFVRESSESGVPVCVVCTGDVTRSQSAQEFGVGQSYLRSAIYLSPDEVIGLVLGSRPASGQIRPGEAALFVVPGNHDTCSYFSGLRARKYHAHFPGPYPIELEILDSTGHPRVCLWGVNSAQTDRRHHLDSQGWVPPTQLKELYARLRNRMGQKAIKVVCLPGISVLAIPRWSGYSDPRLGCKVFVFLSRSMLRSLPFGSLNAARSPRSSSLEGFSPTRLRVVPSSATQRLFSVAAVARYPPGTGSAQIRPSISANSLRLRCPSANSSQ